MMGITTKIRRIFGVSPHATRVARLLPDEPVKFRDEFVSVLKAYKNVKAVLNCRGEVILYTKNRKRKRWGW